MLNPKRKRGRPFKNEAVQSVQQPASILPETQSFEPKVKGKRGRPFGSKNKPKPEDSLKQSINLRPKINSVHVNSESEQDSDCDSNFSISGSDIPKIKKQKRSVSINDFDPSKPPSDSFILYTNSRREQLLLEYPGIFIFI